jgi:hypothetical protein
VTAVRLRNPTGRNTKARVVEIGPHAFFFSYETLIAYAGPLGRARRANVWSRTTGRHFREMGCAGFPIVEPDELEARVLRTVAAEHPERRVIDEAAPLSLRRVAH